MTALAPRLVYEHQAWDSGHSEVAGVDEAGRGPLAGSVVAAAVIFSRSFLLSDDAECFLQLTDSKVLTEVARNHFFGLLTTHDAVKYGVGIVSAAEIDQMNILRATHCAMARAIADMPVQPSFILVDGRPVSGLPVPSQAIVKGDRLSLSIAAGSVIAKVTRDKMLYELDQEFPEYGFARHKGYGTKAHLEALSAYGPCREHRRSFRPVRECLSGPVQGDLFDGV